MWSTECERTADLPVEVLWETWIKVLSGEIELPQGDRYEPREPVGPGASITMTPAGQDSVEITGTRWEPPHVQAGLVLRQQDPKDARARIVTTTAAGRDVGARATRLVEDADEAYFATMPHLRDALLRDAGAVVCGPAAHHGEATDASFGQSTSPKTSGDTAGPTMVAAP